MRQVAKKTNIEIKQHILINAGVTVREIGAVNLYKEYYSKIENIFLNSPNKRWFTDGREVSFYKGEVKYIKDLGYPEEE